MYKPLGQIGVEQMKIIKTKKYAQKEENNVCIGCGKKLSDDDLAFDGEYCYRCKKRIEG